MEKKNNWIIFGCSPFIIDGAYGQGCEIKIHASKLARVLDLFDKYTTLGLNYFPLKCDYRMVLDNGHVLNCYQDGEHLISSREIRPDLLYYNSVGKEDLRIKPYYEYELGKELTCVYSIIETALQYATMRGAENIILIGVDLTEGWQPEHMAQYTIKEIEKYNNVYKVNEQSRIGVPTWTEINLN